jgi:hypothetical protein
MKAGKPTVGAGFGGALRYVAEKPRAQLIASNMVSVNTKERAQEMHETANQNTRCKKPVLHMTLSLLPGEKLNGAKAREVCEDFMKKMGVDLEKQQYVICRHRDRKHEHYHIVVNRINCDGKCWDDSKSYEKAMRLTPKLEKAHGLEITPSFEAKRAKKAIEKDAHEMADRLGVEHPRKTIARRVEAAINECNGTREDFKRKLAEIGVEMRESTRRNKLGVSYRLLDCPKEFRADSYKGSRIGTAYTGPSVEKRLHEHALNRVKQMKHGAGNDGNKPSAFDRLRSASLEKLRVPEPAKIHDEERAKGQGRGRERVRGR